MLLVQDVTTLKAYFLLPLVTVWLGIRMEKLARPE